MYEFSDKPAILRYRRRAERALEEPDRSTTLNNIPTTPEGIQLQSGEEGVIYYKDLLEALADRDNDDRRRLAINAVNDLSRRYTDLLTGQPTVKLSDAGLFPSWSDQELPNAVRITYGREQIVDTQWTALYNVQDARGTENKQFTIEDVYSAASFQRYEEGEEIEIKQVEGGSATYEYYIYAAALQWTRFWEDWTSMWQENDGTAMMQARHGQHQASRAYSVLTAGSPGTTSYQNFDSSGSTSITNDVATFNEAATDILNNMYTAGSPQSGEQVDEEFQNPNFYILVSQFDNSLATRAGRALQSNYDAPNDNMSNLETRFPMQIIQTPHVSTGSWYMVFPGRKNIARVARDLTMYDKTEVQAAGIADANIAQSAWRMVRGDDNQVQNMATS